MKSYQQLLHDPPKTVRWAGVVDFDRLDERRSAIDCLYVNTLGVNMGYVEWSPNDSPPSREETLAWLWFIRPDLGSEIAGDAPECLCELIRAYQSGDMEAWWNKS